MVNAPPQAKKLFFSLDILDTPMPITPKVTTWAAVRVSLDEPEQRYDMRTTLGSRYPAWPGAHWDSEDMQKITYDRGHIAYMAPEDRGPPRIISKCERFYALLLSCNPAVLWAEDFQLVQR